MTPEEVYLSSLVSPLAQDPGSLRIERTIDERGVLLSLRTSEADMPRIIGKAGKIANAVRDLLHTFGSQRQMKLSLLIKEPIR